MPVQYEGDEASKSINPEKIPGDAGFDQVVVFWME
jgi:hypothetical protein